MKVLLINILLFVVLFSSSAHSENMEYWDIVIPTIKGATEVKNEKDEKFYSIVTITAVPLTFTVKPTEP